MIDFQKRTRAVARDSIVSSWRMATFSRSCSVVVRQNSTSRQRELLALLIPPDTDTDLVIELKLIWAWFSSADEGVRLLPAFTGSAKVGRIEFDELGTPEDGVVHDSLSR
jgi:hypothetical protein